MQVRWAVFQRGHAGLFHPHVVPGDHVDAEVGELPNPIISRAAGQTRHLPTGDRPRKLMTRLNSMSQSCPPLSLDSGVLLQALVDGDRIRKAKELAEQKALAAAKTELQRALVLFQHRLKDFFQQWGEDGPRPVLLRIYVRVDPLAKAALQLAEAAKRAMPSQRVSEFIRLAFELNGHSSKDGPFDELSPDLRQSLKDSIIFARELEMMPESPSEPKRKRSLKKSGQVSASHDMLACRAVAEHSKAGRPWSISSIARELGVARTALNGKNARGEYRCPNFMSHVRQRGKRITMTYSEMVEDEGCND